jgi:hypothetical protein
MGPLMPILQRVRPLGKRSGEPPLGLSLLSFVGVSPDYPKLRLFTLADDLVLATGWHSISPTKRATDCNRSFAAARSCANQYRGGLGAAHRSGLFDVSRDL